MRSSLAVLLFVSVAAGDARAGDSLDVLVAAYPQALAGRDADSVIFRNGEKVGGGILHAAAPPEWLLTHASVRDQFSVAYPRDVLALQRHPSADPGRFRNKAFFDALYGDCHKGEVDGNIEQVAWLPHDWRGTARVTRLNGVAEALRAVSDEIQRLPPSVRRAAWPIEGDYDCRNVAVGGQPSMHAYGAAVDLNLHFSEYWLWDAGKDARVIPYRNRMPLAIVGAFEHHGFIWGGKWYHYDTMHFEYRPEMLGQSAIGIRR